MKILANLCNSVVTLCLICGASLAQAAPHPLMQATMSNLCATGQANNAPAGESREEAERLVGLARKAMAAGKLTLAEHYIVQAERLNVKYDPIFSQFNNTPARARQELEQRKRSVSSTPPFNAQRSAYPGAFGNSSATTPPIDPFAARKRDADPTTLPDANNVTPSPVMVRPDDEVAGRVDPVRSNDTSDGLGSNRPARIQTNQTPIRANPKTDSTFSDAERSFKSSVSSTSANVGTQSTKAMLLEARLALARRDLRLANELANQAKNAGGPLSILGDSPQKVESLIRRFNDLANGRNQGDPDRFAGQYARALMEQADWLIQYKEFDLAETSAKEAKSKNAKYLPFERTPDKILAHIARQKNSSPESTDRGNQTIKSPGNTSQAKAEALALVAKARLALNQNKIESANQFIQQAIDLKVPDDQFGKEETRPWQLKLQIDLANKQRRSAGTSRGNQLPVRSAGANRQLDRSRNAKAGFQLPPSDNDSPISQPAVGAEPSAQQLFVKGLKALDERKSSAALNHFRQAWKLKDQLDEHTQQLLQDQLTALQSKAAAPLPTLKQSTPLDEAEREKYLLVNKLRSEIFRESELADKARAKDPRGALKRLQSLRERVKAAKLDPAVNRQLLTLVDRRVRETERYIQLNLPKIENDERNKSRLADIEDRRNRKIMTENKLAKLVVDFNKLMDELRYAEAEAIARQATELDPDNPVVQNLTWKSRTARRLRAQMDLRDRSEQGFVDAMNSAEGIKVPFDDRDPYQFGDAKTWKHLSGGRLKHHRERGNRLSASEIKIHQALTNTKVDVRFKERPLREAMDVLEASAGVNIHLDERGLHAEGITPSEPVTLNLIEPITLKSALNLILERFGLSYVIQNEVIKVTSEQLRDENVYPRTYYVADLVIPIPNFVPSYNMGLPGAIAHAQNQLAGNRGGFGGSGSVPMSVQTNFDIANPVTNNPKVLANMGQNGLPGSARSPLPLGYGPGGMRGTSQADFESLIELLTATISPESWDDVGGPGTAKGFENNLSLVVSQTQEVHEEIAELLEQLRRLQDLQVTIEVRFITLNDNFFERVGIDFDFEIKTDSGLQGDGMGGIVPGSGPANDRAVIGVDPTGNFTGDLDLVFSQDSFTSAVPQFGGFDAATAANFGFAILSDLEVFFLIQASQGDSRSNVVQAPKATLFNGQSATVSDTSQRPFVTSVVPVVGDFAAAHQPVIVVLSEGTTLSVQAVISADRRFVRLTLVPFFSSIGDVQEFTFTGKKVAQSNTPQYDSAGNPTGQNSTTSDVIEGTTVQLPTFNFTTVQTTVSVPDGGTVLMGGIKRLSEGRSERGVPMLAQLPYISRLFKNVGIGRSTQSLMMMVTPRIIIQEEEELDQTGLDSSQL